MSNIGTSKGLLEVGKFALYVAIPVALMYTFANNTKNLQRIMGNDRFDFVAFCPKIECSHIVSIVAYMKRSYVVYPPEAPRPPSPEEMREMARELAGRRNNP